MYLKGWRPRLSNGSLPFDTNCFFTLEVDIACPACGIEDKIMTDATAPDCNNLERFIQSQIHEVKGERPCKSCGSLSKLPDTTTRKLKNEMTILITPEWIREARKTAIAEEIEKHR